MEKTPSKNTVQTPSPLLSLSLSLSLVVVVEVHTVTNRRLRYTLTSGFMGPSRVATGPQVHRRGGRGGRRRELTFVTS